jgi:tetratricopeptide (TPR) repeat protein
MKSEPKRFLNVLMILVLAGATLVVFGPIVFHRFVGWDDDINLYDNPYLNPASLKSTAYFWKAPYYKLYIPMTYSLWAGLAWVVERLHPASMELKNHPAPFHAASLVFHFANVLLVYSILRLLLRRKDAGSGPSPDAPPKKKDKSRGKQGSARPERQSGEQPESLWTGIAACGGALLFALHPVQVEPVAWATGMKDLLGGFFSFLSLRLYLGYAVRTEGKGKALRFILATLFFLVGLLAKPSTAAVPFVAACLDYFLLRRKASSIAWASGLWVACLIPWFLATTKLQPAPGPGLATPLWARPFIAGDTLTFYLAKLVLPIRHAIDYGWTPEYILRFWWTYAAWLVPLALTIFLVRSRNRFLIASAGVFAAGILPVLGFVSFQHQGISTVADRYLYLSMLGSALALTYAIAAWGAKRPRLVLVLAAAVLVAFGVRSAIQVPCWRDSYVFFENTLAVNPRSAICHNNLGHAFFLDNRYDEAIAHYKTALALSPDYGTVHNNLGNVYLFQGRVEDAVPQYLAALKCGTVDDRIDAYNNLGIASDRLGRTDEAIGYYRKVLELRPEYDKTFNNLALVLARKGEIQEALRLYRRALELKPNYGDAQRNLAGLLNDQGIRAINGGNLREAIAFYEEAVRVRPDFLKAQVNLGDAKLMMGDPDGAIGVWMEALRFLPSSPELHHNLAVSWLQKGNREKAREYLEKALVLKPDFEMSRRMLDQLNAEGLSTGAPGKPVPEN